MCGICGKYNYINGCPVYEQELIAMCRVMKHRGPDDEGLYMDNSIGLGHRRLSIIDLSTGHQPMFNRDKSLCIVYNGEVYNYLELKKELMKRGRRFVTSSDTEVILYAYEEYGEDCVHEFNGMFAFAIWNERTQTLFLARDKTGIKPLYYTLLNGGFIFASEIKALFECEGVRAEVNAKAMDSFLTFGYVFTEETMFKGIKKLLPGQTLTVRNGNVLVKQYWDLNFNVDFNGNISEKHFVDELRELLRRSVKIRLRSDVPLGVFLSGGIDSSTVVGLLSKMRDEPIKTFSISFDRGQKFDESNYARLISKKFNTEHYEMILTPEKYGDFISEFTWYMDEPVTEPTAISLFYVSRLASEHVKVVLSGEGSDELFAGYPIYRYMQILERIQETGDRIQGKNAESCILSPVFCFLSTVSCILPLRRIQHLVSSIKKYSFLSSLPLEQRYLGVNLYDVGVKQKLYSPGFKEHINNFDSTELIRPLYEKTKLEDILNRMLYLDVKTWLPNYILIKSDRMSMATSIELRLPFLDHDLIDFAATIPPQLKLNGSTTKYLLKKAMEDILPKEIIYRKKMGFPTPLTSMFRQELKEYVSETLLNSKAKSRGYFDASVIQSMVKEHLAGKADHHKLIWQLLVLEEWHRCFIDAR